MFEHYRDADAAIEYFANISHFDEPILATASVTARRLVKEPERLTPAA